MAIFEAGRPKCSDSGVGYAYDVLVDLSDPQHIKVFPVGGMSEFTQVDKVDYPTNGFVNMSGTSNNEFAIYIETTC